jgi:hydrogenase nickel incorporation protein HypB
VDPRAFPDYAHDHRDHAHAPAHGRTVRLEKELLAKNDAFARENRAWLEERGVCAVNLVSSPGAGKTALLEGTVRMLDDVSIFVIEGDQETERDTARMRAAGVRAVQINTGAGCHLDAHRVGHALGDLDPPPGSLVFIENVGNLVCPALFDLGETAKAVVLSTPEGDDKPLKYPNAFRASRALVLNKIDLLPHVTFDVEKSIRYARSVNPELEVLRVSATRGVGLPEWCAWLRGQMGAPRASAS